MSKLMTPSVPNRPVTSARAAVLGRYPSIFIAASTRSRVDASTFSRLLATRETVWDETPAIAATSAMEGDWRSGRDLGDLAPTSRDM